jgi:hypothetical protein
MNQTTLADALHDAKTVDSNGIVTYDWKNPDFIIENVGVDTIVDTVKEQDEVLLEGLNILLSSCFHKKLALALLDLAEQEDGLYLGHLPLEERVAEWIKSKSAADTELAMKILTHENTKVQTKAAQWIIAMLPYSSEILNYMLHSENEKVQIYGKRWFHRIKGDLGTYRIKKTGEELDITQDGQVIKLESFPSELVEELQKIPYDVVLQAKQFLIDLDKGEQLVIEDLNQISENNLQHLFSNVQKRMGLLDVLAGAMNWNNLESVIINHKVFYESME